MNIIFTQKSRGAAGPDSASSLCASRAATVAGSGRRALRRQGARSFSARASLRRGRGGVGGVRHATALGGKAARGAFRRLGARSFSARASLRRGRGVGGVRHATALGGRAARGALLWWTQPFRQRLQGACDGGARRMPRAHSFPGQGTQAWPVPRPLQAMCMSHLHSTRRTRRRPRRAPRPCLLQA